MRDGGIFLKNLRHTSFNKIYRMSLILAWSISLESTLKTSRKGVQAWEFLTSRFLHHIWVGDLGIVKSEMGKHPDLLVAHPTSTIFTTIGRNYEIS